MQSYFTINLGFEKMHATPQMITTAMQLYFTGESFRNVKQFLKLQGVKMSHVAVYKWIRKYVGLMENYLDKIKPNVGDAWRTDELFVKVKGDMKYLYALMDDETRFWIAQQVADTKYTANINPLFKQGKELTGKRPNTLISDGAPNFNDSTSITYIIQHSEKYHIPVPNRDSLKRMSDKIHHLISEINMSSDGSLQSARTEKTDRDLTKPQKEIFYRRQEEGYENTSTTFTISIFAYLTKRARLSCIQDEEFYYLSSFSIMASIFLSKLSN